MSIKIQCDGKVSLPYNGVSQRKIMSVVKKGCEALSLDNISLSIILTDDAVIKKINREFRKKNYATDVISFAYREYDFPQIGRKKEHLGDIFISLQKAETQAEEYGVSFLDEMIRLIVHALCHCIGYDHELSRKDEIKMQKREDEVISYILSR